MGHASLLFSWCTFLSSGCTTLFTFLFYRGHSLHLCPSSPHLKHLTATVLMLLITLSSTPYCITRLFKTSNLFWGISAPFSSSLLFLQFQARCPNLLQLLQSFSFLPSNSTLSLARARFSLSRLLNKVLYYSWDIIITSQGDMELMVWSYLMLRLLGRKIFIQPDTYCPTDYCPNTMVSVITESWRLRDHSRWVFRKNSMEFSIGFDYLLILLYKWLCSYYYMITCPSRTFYDHMTLSCDMIT